MYVRIATWCVGGLAGTLLIAAQAPALHADATPVEITTPLPTATPAPDGFWPTQNMVESMLLRWAADATEDYDLRPDQQRQVEQKLVERWTGFLEENRRELQPLINEYIEARLALTPPSADAVADWAARAMPVFQRLKANVDEGEQDVAELLNADQRARFEQNRQQRQFGLQFVEGQLKRWSVGNFKQREWWDPPAGYRDQQKRREAAANDTDQPDTGQDAAADEPPARITDELSAWEKYVSDFCTRLELDQAQRNAADSILRELLDRARDHVARNRVRIAALERKILTGSGEEDEAFDRELTELYGPLDAMFRELDLRLNQLPTSAQRRRADPAAQTEEGPDETEHSDPAKNADAPRPAE